jgi:hypothetical protein
VATVARRLTSRASVDRLIPQIIIYE